MDKCRYCGKPLANKKTIWSCEGILYCSRKCGAQALATGYGPVDSDESAERHFDDYAEEINPRDIGIK